MSLSTTIETTRIPDRPEAEALLDTDVFAVDGGNGLRKVTVAEVKAAVAESISNGTAFQTTAARILEMATNGSYNIPNQQFDSDGAPLPANVVWIDGSTGVYTPTLKNSADPSLIDAYTITHASSSKTVTQSAVTRDSDGRITNQPTLTIA